MEYDIFGKLVTSRIMVFNPDKYPNPLTPNTLKPNRGALRGGQGGYMRGLI